MTVTSIQAKWIAIEAVTKPGEVHYFDPETMQIDDHVRRIWILSSYEIKQKGGYHAVKTLYEFDCAQNKVRSITLLLYPDRKATGTVIGARHEESIDWVDFSTDSIFHHVLEVACID